MSRNTIWLLAGATLSLYAAAGAAVAAEPDQARAQAERDAAAAPKPDEARRTERREIRIYRHGDGDAPTRTVMMHRGGEDRAEHLRTMLQLRPEQEPALKAYVEAAKPGAGRAISSFTGKPGDKTTMERLTEMEARLAEQQAMTRKRIDATKAFYAQLDARQKKAFDAMPMLMMVGPDIGPMMIPVPPAMPVRFEMRRHDGHIDVAPPAPPPPPTPPRS